MKRGPWSPMKILSSIFVAWRRTQCSLWVGVLILFLGQYGRVQSQTPPDESGHREDLPPMLPEPPVDPRAKYLIDKERLYLKQVKDLVPIQSEDQSQGEFNAYNDIVLFARQFPTDELVANANEMLYGDLFTFSRKEYRFDLIKFEGRLKRVLKLPPNGPLKNAGIQELYEAWVYPGVSADPVCILLSELPDGLQPSVEYSPAHRVTVAGYYFKVIKYESAQKSKKNPDRNMLRVAPFIIGHSLVLKEPLNSSARKDWTLNFLPIFLGLIGFISLTTLGLTWWFRKGDQAAKEVIERQKQNPFAADSSMM